MVVAAHNRRRVGFLPTIRLGDELLLMADGMLEGIRVGSRNA